jgi:hypothetical protein
LADQVSLKSLPIIVAILFRTVYTVRFAVAVYVLHAFQKKSRKGVATPKSDIALVKSRLQDAERLSRGEPRPHPQARQQAHRDRYRPADGRGYDANRHTSASLQDALARW